MGMRYVGTKKILGFTIATALALVPAQPASAQDLSILAEIPRVGGFSNTLLVQKLARGGPPFLVMVASGSVQAWPVGSVAEPIVSPGVGTANAAWGDFDGDGFLDLVVARRLPGVPGIGSNEIVILKGNGSGSFVESASIFVDGEGLIQARVIGMASGDFDGDGRVDLAVLSNQSQRPVVLVYRSRGGLSFAVPRSTDISPNFGRWLTAGDVDGDGRADLVISTDDYLGSVSVWRSAGDGTLVPGTLNLTGRSVYAALLADLDGDGRPDLVYLSRVGSEPGPVSYHVEAYHNDGEGRFSPMARQEVRSYAGRLVVVDADGDGKLDIVLPQDDGGGRYLALFHHGPGGFTRTAVTSATVPSDFVSADWDSDGSADFVFATTRGIVVVGRGASRTDVTVLPVLLSTTGLSGARFDSDLLLTNAGTTAVLASLRYVAASGAGTGTIERRIPAQGQLYARSALDFLRDAGLTISRDGPLYGTLRASVTGASSPQAFCATVRTTTPAGAGVSFGGIARLDALRGTSFVPWLVESERDRTNLALMNAGGPDDGPVTLRITVESGDPATPGRAVLPDVVLEPGGFQQVGRVLAAAGLATRLGWARIARVSGSAPYLAWAAVNDSGSGDGSFVPAVADSVLGLQGGWIIPVVIQSDRYATELIVTNPGNQPAPFTVTLAATGTVLAETLAPGATFRLPDLFAELRRRGLPGAPAAGAAIASPLYVGPYSSPRPVLAGVRVTSTSTEGRSYGLFEPADLRARAYSVVVPDLRQDASARTNLGIVNTGEPATLRLEIFDGVTGRLAAARDGIRLASSELLQLNAVLRDMSSGVERGWARIRSEVFSDIVAYAVINDGPRPGRGTDDGSFVLGIPEQ